jgi:hypothetical protein
MGFPLNRIDLIDDRGFPLVNGTPNNSNNLNDSVSLSVLVAIEIFIP